ncbi:hypothetical protein H8959_007471 [Pygathrix nigripes]
MAEISWPTARNSRGVRNQLEGNGPAGDSTAGVRAAAEALENMENCCARASECQAGKGGGFPPTQAWDVDLSIGADLEQGRPHLLSEPVCNRLTFEKDSFFQSSPTDMHGPYGDMPRDYAIFKPEVLSQIEQGKEPCNWRRPGPKIPDVPVDPSPVGWTAKEDEED